MLTFTATMEALGSQTATCCVWGAMGAWWRWEIEATLRQELRRAPWRTSLAALVLDAEEEMVSMVADIFELKVIVGGGGRGAREGVSESDQRGGQRGAGAGR